METIVLTYIGYFFLGLLGLLTHFLKKKITGQTLESIKEWFVNHPKDAILSVVAFIISFLVFHGAGELSYLTSFMAGYMCDSIFTRIEEKAETRQL